MYDMGGGPARINSREQYEKQMSNRYVDPRDLRPAPPNPVNQEYDKPMFEDIKIGNGGYDMIGPTT